MKRIVFSLCLAVLTLSTSCADTYHDALLTYMQKGNAVDKQQYEQMLQPMVAQLFPNDVEGASAAFSEYASSQMINDLTALYEPAFRKHVSEQELHELIATFSDPQFAEIQQKTTNLVQNFNQSEEYQQFAAQLEMAIGDIMAGKKAANMPVPASISMDYIDTFNRYYQVSGTEEIIAQTFASMTTMLEQMLQSSTSNAKQITGDIMSYIQANMKTVLVSIFVKTITQQDLQLLISNTDSDAYRHSIDAVKEVVVNPMQLAVQLIDKMADWMSAHHPQYAAPLKETAKAMKGL